MSFPEHAFAVVSDDVPVVTGLLQRVSAGGGLPPVVPLGDAGGFAQDLGSSHTLVMIAATSLRVAAPLVSSAARQHHLAGLVIEMEEPEWFPQVLHDAGLRTVRKTLVHHPSDAVRQRILAARTLGAEDDLVARVRVEGDVLVALTCGLDEVRVPFEAHSALRRLPASERPHVHLSDEGHRLSWLDGRVEVDLDGLRYAVDPDYAASVDLSTVFRGGTYGAAIREVRRAHGLRQSDVPGLSERQIRRIERDGTASFDALRALADAHQLGLNAYLDALADRAADLRA